MLELKTKQKLAQEAYTLAQSFELVRYRDVTYLPVDYEKGTELPEPKRTVWTPLRRKDVRMMASRQFGTLFATDSELNSFDFMVAQNAKAVESAAPSLLVRAKDGLRMLNEEGVLVEPTGEFLPNALTPVLNDDAKTKAMVLATIVEWVDSEEDAHSLLYHLATCLSPGYSAVKYVLLIGEGRNGKSVLMKMMKGLFGKTNVSHVTRQHISDAAPAVIDLNAKLLNLVFDGQATYLKDSGTEKSLVAGETVAIKRLYESSLVEVETNALFVEGLNKEPKSNDKSTALQKRLVRFQFPNYYPQDHVFEKTMLRGQVLGAFLGLLIDHFVKEDEVAEKLAPTRKAVELQLEHMYVNSLALQFLKHLEETDVLGVNGILDAPVSDLVPQFTSWRIKENDLGTWTAPDVEALFKPLLHSERKSHRVNGQPRKVRVVTALKDEALAFVESLKGVADDGDPALEPGQSVVDE